MGTWLRSPKTTNEQRQTEGHMLDGHDVRGSRRPVTLPDAWDDIIRSDLYDRNWKRFRKTKWRQPTPV